MTPVVPPRMPMMNSVPMAMSRSGFMPLTGSTCWSCRRRRWHGRLSPRSNAQDRTCSNGKNQILHVLSLKPPVFLHVKTYVLWKSFAVLLVRRRVWFLRLPEHSSMTDHKDQDRFKGAVEQEEPNQEGNTSMQGQLGHRDQDEMIKDADSDFPEPGQSPEHSGEPVRRKTA